jgi:hypothetical protein
MGGNPRDSGLGQLQGYIQNLLDTGQGQMNLRDVPTTQGLNALTNQYYNAGNANLGREIDKAGQLGAARGYSQGLSNPFAYAQRAENDARSGLGNLEAQRAGQLMQNPLTAYGLKSQATQYNANLINQLLGMKAGVTGQREGNVAQDVIGSVIGGAGELLGLGFGAGAKTPAGAQADLYSMTPEQRDAYRRMHGAY